MAEGGRGDSDGDGDGDGDGDSDGDGDCSAVRQAAAGAALNLPAAGYEQDAELMQQLRCDAM
jgi:hypothetical protein